MKPEEFDVLIRHKFEHNDFDYDARNWDRLAEELDGHNKKRGMLLWWVPLMGIAASVALAFGFTTALKEGGHALLQSDYSAMALLNAYNNPEAANRFVVPEVHNNVPATHTTATFCRKPKLIAENSHDGAWKININNALAYHATKEKTFTLGENFAQPDNEVIKKKKVVIERKIASTFRDDVKPTQPAKVMVTLSGGVNYGNQMNGYTVGATARRMVNKQVFVESDIAFIGTNNNTSIKYSEQVNATGSVNQTSNVGPNVGARLSSDPSSVKAKMTNATPPPPTERDAYRKESFNLDYAQVTPSVGYMLMKHLSLAAGPDFQQMLVDNRPAPSTVDRGTITTEPVFDLGFIGKMEMGVSKNLKAAVFYREGINNIVTPMHGFIDRNYVQFQLKYAILKR